MQIKSTFGRLLDTTGSLAKRFGQSEASKQQQAIKKHANGFISKNLSIELWIFESPGGGLQGYPLK
jgi:hypothetical protein